MKKKLSDEYVKKRLAQYGYTVNDDFKYTNNTTYFPVYDEVNNQQMNLTWKNFNYYIKKGRKKYKRPDVLNIGLRLFEPDQNGREKESRPKDSFERWTEKQDEYIKSMNIIAQKSTFDFRNNALKQLLKKKDLH